MPHDQRDLALTEADVLADPLAQLERWLRDATAAGLIEPTAMALASVAQDGRPSARMVLFKGFHDGGLTFYTNYESRKGQELAANPRVALLFWWDKLERSVRVEGRVEKLGRRLSEEYFHSRPRISQISASVSRQSSPVKDRATLERRYRDFEQKLGNAEVPLPGNWGGYLARPERFEFWQGRQGRLHDRLVYEGAGRGWTIVRLEP